MPKRYDLFSQETLTDPYQVYSKLRSEDPVHLDDLLGCWVLTRYSDVVVAFSHPHLSSERLKSDRLQGKGWEQVYPLFQVISKQLLFLDPPEHTRIRTLLKNAFSPRIVEGMRTRIEQIVNNLLDSVRENGRMDVIQDLAYQLPITIIAEMLGVPPEDHQQLKEWSNEFAEFLGSTPTLNRSQRASEAVLAQFDYFRHIVEQQRKAPKDNLLNALIMAENRDDILNEEELLATCVMLFIAGNVTTTNLIGNGLLALIQHPDQMLKLKKDFSLLSGAIEEILRYDSPSQWTGRLVKECIEIDGKRIDKGQGIMLMQGAANRDPAQFDNPDQFKIDRSPNRHLAFGHSIHACIGAKLARIEGQVAIATILRRLPTLHLATDKLEWQGSLGLRGLKSLPVVFKYA